MTFAVAELASISRRTVTLAVNSRPSVNSFTFAAFPWQTESDIRTLIDDPFECLHLQLQRTRGSDHVWVLDLNVLVGSAFPPTNEPAFVVGLSKQWFQDDIGTFLFVKALAEPDSTLLGSFAGDC